MLGLALEQVGRTAEALAEFPDALQLRPDYAAPRFNLANNAEIKQGKLEEAIEHLRQVVAANPANALARSRLEGALEAERARNGAAQR
jgi:tetratricopeptide (TPR) repeat protein